MPAILPKDCCDCSLVVDACQCQQDYIVTASGFYTSNYSQFNDCPGYNGRSFGFISSFSDIINTLTVVTDTNYLIGGSVPCGTTGSLTDTLCESTLSCTGGLKDSIVINYILCGGEDSCNETGGVQTQSTQRPYAGYLGAVNATHTSTAGNYIFSIGGISITTIYALSWSDAPGGTETGELTLSQDFAATQTIPLYGTWNLPFGFNPINTKSGSCTMSINISKSV